jgi:hypothetical protein
MWLLLKIVAGRCWDVLRGRVARPGAVAPDFDLPSADGMSRVRLSSFRGSKPVVLIFGSYS